MNTAKLNILMLSWELAPLHSGGLGVASYGLAQALSQLGHQVSFYVPEAHPGFSRLAIAVYSAATLKVPEQVSVPVSDALTEPLPSAYGHILQDLFATKKREDPLVPAESYGEGMKSTVVQYAQKAPSLPILKGIDLIHAHDWMSVATAVQLSKLTGKPWVFHVHSTEYDRSGDWGDASLYAMEKWGVEAADHIVSVSYFTQSQLVKRYGADPKKCSVVYNGGWINRETSYARTKKPFPFLVSFIGRITGQKGPDLYLKAAQQICKYSDEVHFAMAGSGDLLFEMIELAQKLGISDRVHFTGRLDEQDVRHLLQWTDVFVLSSISEPFGIAPLEAAAMGKPVILSKNSGLAEVFKDTLLVDPQDAETIAEAIMGLKNYPKLVRLLQEKSLDLAEVLSWDRSALSMVDVYKKFAGK